MNRYLEAYQKVTSKTAPATADQLTGLFDAMAAGELLPPKGQQAVDCGFLAHTFNDPTLAPTVYDYYQWVTGTYLAGTEIRELSAKLIGMAFTSQNVFKTDLPQPVTLNPWQVEKMQRYPLMTDRAIVVENNGVFIWLAYRHPQWPLINQSGNDFNPAYVTLMRALSARGVALTYLGDIDTPGIRIAAKLYEQLPTTPIEQFTALQTPDKVSYWLALKGRRNEQRTKAATFDEPTFQEEAAAIHTYKCVVEQEQLIATYEQLIPEWLNSNVRSPK